jgi:tellurite methyltransferase
MSEHLFQKADGILDLRKKSEYQAGHLQGSTSILFKELDQSLNQLPASPATLFLVGDKDEIEAASVLLASKGYDINGSIVLTVKTFTFWKSALSKHWQEGGQSRRLWKPSSIVMEWIELYHSTRLSEKSERISALDLGCGGGRDAVFLAQNRINVMAIDRESKVLKRAKSLAQSCGASLKFKCCALGNKDCLPDTQFDLILGVRFLNRQIIPHLTDLLKPNGYLVWQTFVDNGEAINSPKNKNAILDQGELAEVFESLEIIVDRIDSLPDGRPVNSFIARKKS